MCGVLECDVIATANGRRLSLDCDTSVVRPPRQRLAPVMQLLRKGKVHFGILPALHLGNFRRVHGALACRGPLVGLEKTENAEFKDSSKYSEASEGSG